MRTKDKSVELRKIKARINWMCEHKINAFSPTISPAPKSVARGEIESIFGGLRYFYERGVQDIVVQKKYMGSYCDIYLHKELDDTYFVSRNGYKIEHINLTEAKMACEELHNRFDWNDLDVVIIQAELMPWNILGKGLIEAEYEGYFEAHETRLNYLKTSGLYEKIQQVKMDIPFQNYLTDKSEMSNGALKKKYPAHVIRQYSALESFQALNLSNYEKGVEVFGKQVNHFAKEDYIYFKPFNILKKVFADGHEEIPNDNSTYKLVNADEMKAFHIDSMESLERIANELYTWFETLTDHMEEGIVIKPLKAFVANLPPALKVRNNNYLTMIYGIDFMDNLSKQINKRNIKGKLACSKNDWAINYKLLSVPHNDIQKENYYYKNLMLDRILEEETESALDPTL
ncbi:DNA ligase-like domain-containing protein [Rhizosphaericola mali]|uniref:Polynucleotide kinase-phosphatase ligase domain-containing protein n=1 Tax=Rhizosphaericola mali TaxID=2545455 RepID=A0A5P2G7N0_9BACT|nr:hypothetical protein [Rhizosphaericola mali]QES90708.1 hypothetical protein E0W69_019305 [Rhizosphaericola mali]